MRPIGFSTGALAYGDFNRALAVLKSKRISIVEISALRENELAPLIAALDNLDLSHFRYVSIHAPSKFEPSREKQIIELLRNVVNRGWPVILHPDTAYDFSAWNDFGELLFIENMDKRNQTGRSAQELSEVFEKLPNAGLCFDLGHCRQVDPTMNESYVILHRFGPRLRQVHISEVNSRSTHDPLSGASIAAFRHVSGLIPPCVPIILESPVPESGVESEVESVRSALPLPSSSNGHRRELARVQSAAL